MLSRSSRSDTARQAYHLTHDEVVGGSMEGFKFDVDICKQAFDYYDTNKSGTLDSGELMRLSEVLWDTFYPNGPKIDAQTKAFMVAPSPSLDLRFLRQPPWAHRRA